MSDINVMALTGRLTRDAETKSANGKEFATFRLAFSQGKDSTGYVDVAYFGPQGVTPYLRKGTQVGIEGSLSWREWEKDGNKHQSYSVRSYRVNLLGSKSDDGGMKQAVDDLGGDEIPFS